jgi:hypothetical protein
MHMTTKTRRVDGVTIVDIGYKRLVAPPRLFRLLADAVGKQKRDRFHDPSSDLNDQVPLI